MVKKINEDKGAEIDPGSDNNPNINKEEKTMEKKEHVPATGSVLEADDQITDYPEAAEPEVKPTTGETDGIAHNSRMTMDSTSIIEISTMDNKDYSAKIVAEADVISDFDKLKQLRERIIENECSK